MSAGTVSRSLPTTIAEAGSPTCHGATSGTRFRYVDAELDRSPAGWPRRSGPAGPALPAGVGETRTSPVENDPPAGVSLVANRWRCRTPGRARRIMHVRRAVGEPDVWQTGRRSALTDAQEPVSRAKGVRIAIENARVGTWPRGGDPLPLRPRLLGLCTTRAWQRRGEGWLTWSVRNRPHLHAPTRQRRMADQHKPMFSGTSTGIGLHASRPARRMRGLDPGALHPAERTTTTRRLPLARACRRKTLDADGRGPSATRT
jgi:hypothetical protein